jgi:hypothetical protein
MVGSNPLSIDASFIDCQPDSVGLLFLKVTSARPGEVGHGIQRHGSFYSCRESPLV